jgi:hypothetical protein
MFYYHSWFQVINQKAAKGKKVAHHVSSIYKKNPAAAMNV